MLGAFKKMFKNQTEKVKSKEKVILSMPMFQGDKAYSLDAVVEDLKQHWKLNVKDIEGDDTVAILTIEDETVAIALMPIPIPTQELEPLYEYSYLWDGVEEETKAHTRHAIVSVMSGSKDIIKRYSILSKVNASILRTCENAIGVYHGTSTLLVPKELYINLAELMKENTLPIQLWVYVGIINDGNKSSVYTYGMKEFDKSEMEIIDVDMEGSELYYFLLSILEYVLAEDIILNDGETIGFTEDEKIKIIESKAVYVDGNSLKLDL